MLEQIRQVLDSVDDPFDRRGLERRFSAPSQASDLLAKSINTALDLDQRLGERLTAATLADELDGVGHPSLLGGEFIESPVMSVEVV